MSKTIQIQVASEETIFTILLDLMRSTQTMAGLSGDEKKAFVMARIKDILGNESYERYQPIISMAIDLLKTISRDKSVLEGLDSLKKKFCFSCIN
jgi:hypothetical protein